MRLLLLRFGPSFPFPLPPPELPGVATVHTEFHFPPYSPLDGQFLR